MRTKTFFLFLCLALAGSFAAIQAQDIEFRGLDSSPMDAAHYPRRAAFQNYLGENDPDRTQYAKVLYSRPQVKGRKIFGELVPWGQEWRLGANEAQEITFFRPVEINNTIIPGGTYTLFADIYPNHWVIKLSTERFIAGTANRDVSQDVVAISVPTQQVANLREYFTIGFQHVNEGKAKLVFEWEHTRAEMPINFNPPMLMGEDVSPMDLVAYPENSRFLNFMESEEDRAANAPQVRVVYSRPQMRDRKIFGELLSYGDMWRVGANETTIITFFEDVTIGGTEISAGSYGLFATVHEDNWEFIIHRSTQSWGPANFDEEMTVAKVTAPTARTPETLEALSMTFVETGDNTVDLVVGWENTMARMPITVRK